MSTGGAGEPGPRQGAGLHPVTVLVLGAAALGACVLLLFGPFAQEYGGVVQLLQWRVESLLRALPFPGPARLVSTSFPGLLLALLVIVLVALPVHRAASRRREVVDGTATSAVQGNPGERRKQSSRISANVSVTFRDGQLVGDDGETGSPMRRRRRDLQLLARSAGIPWSSRYETEGGARAFLELFQAARVGERSTFGPEAGAAGAAGLSAGAEPSSEPLVDAEPLADAGPGFDAEPAFDPEPVGWSGSTSGPAPYSVASAPTDLSRRSPSTPAAEEAAAGAAQGSSSYSGSVYTPTDLYTSARVHGPETGSSRDDGDAGSEGGEA